MKQKWDKGCYVDECTGKEIMGIAWLKAGIRKEVDRGWCLVCLG
jgi:hypothetical protein